MDRELSPSRSEHSGAREPPARSTPSLRDAAASSLVSSAAGNLALGRAFGLQAKLALTEPGDADELEADRVADAVMAGRGAGTLRAGNGGTRIARQCDGCGARLPAESGTCTNCSAESGMESAGGGGGASLPAPALAFFEHSFQRDFGGVRVHADGGAAAASESLGAHAFTRGSDIYFGAGEYQPETQEGRRLIAHELTHTVQQRGAGRVQRKPKAGSKAAPPLPNGPEPFVIPPEFTISNNVLLNASIIGPLAAGTIIDDHDLHIEQRDADTVVMDFGQDRLEIRASPKDHYAFFVEPAPLAPDTGGGPGGLSASGLIVLDGAPKPLVQRTVRVAATSGVSVSAPYHRAGDEGPQLIVHTRWIQSASDADAMAEYVSGPGVREWPLEEGVIQLELDNDRIRISAPNTEHGFQDTNFKNPRYAYYIDPLWTGPGATTKVVFIVASPGVRIEEGHPAELMRSPSLGSYDRHLEAYVIRVPHPDLVPEQGEPIDPDAFTGMQQFYPDDQGEFAGINGAKPAVGAAVGSSGVSIQDEGGARVSIRPRDPDKGSSYAWQVVPRANGLPSELRIVVDSFTRVELDEPVPASVPRDEFGGVFEPDLEKVRHGEGMGSFDVKIVEVWDPAQVPVQGTPLNLQFIAEQGGAYREPDEVRWIFEHSIATDVRIAALETVIGFIPIIGELYFIGQFVYGAVTGRDFWGRKLSTADVVMLGFFAAFSFVGLAMRGVGAAVRMSRIAKIAAALGTTPEKAEIIMNLLRKSVQGEEAAALERATLAMRTGREVAEEDAAILSGVMRRLGATEDLLAGSRWTKSGLTYGIEAEQTTQIGGRSTEIETWYKGLNEETRVALQADRELQTAYEQMDPIARRWLTRCGSLCIPKPPPTKAQIARITSVAEKMGIEKGTFAERRVQAFLQQRRARLEGAIESLEAAAKNETRFTAFLDKQSMADVVLMKRPKLITDAAIRRQVNQAIRDGIDPEKLAEAVDRATDRNTSRMIRYVRRLGRMKKRGIAGVDAVVEDLARGDNFARGAEWMLEYLDSTNQWQRVSAFEVPQQVLNLNAVREIDAIIGGVRYQFKTWHEFYATTFMRQMERDYYLTQQLTQDLKWVFEARGALDTQKAVEAAARTALEDAMRTANATRKTMLQTIIDKLPDIIVVVKP